MILDKLRLACSAGAFCVAAVFAGGADAIEVYPGCAVPPTTFNHVWYFDPVNGKTAAEGGLGTQAAPWNSLQAAFSVQPGYTVPLLSTTPYRHPNPANPANTLYPGGGPIQPGDQILLMSGDYGNVAIGSQYGGANNSPGFLTIAPAPGQAPVLTSLYIVASSGFVFSGLKIQSLGSGRMPLVFVGDGGATFPASNIVFNKLNVSAADPSVYAAWSQADWAANTREGVSAKGFNTTCVSVVDSRVTATHYEVEVFAKNMLVAGNEIDHFGDDGIDYGASNISMTRNYIHDAMEWNIGAHIDGMQGYPGTFSNILIDSNRIIRQADPKLPFAAGYLQGIDAFDGDWTNLTLTNNVVVTRGCWGVGFASVHGGRVINNTVVSDDPTLAKCNPRIAVGDKTHQGSASNDVVVRNNLSNGLGITQSNSSMVLDHNICSVIEGRCVILPIVNGKAQWGIYKPSVYGDHNIIDARGNESEFVNFNPAELVFDLRLKAGARAIGAGSPADAPAVDITGSARGKPVDIGAYRYNPGK